MSKTTFIDGNPALGVEGTIVTASFLNALNNHRHKGSASDGDGAIDYAEDSGAADAYAVDLSPALTGHVVGMPILFLAGNTNTGASTVNINSLGAVAVKKNGASDLAAGDIVDGQVAIIVYDGTYYQLVNNGNAVDLSQFGNTLADPGYQMLPGGLILQWGTSAAIDSGATRTITLPVTFPTAGLNLMVQRADLIGSDSNHAVSGTIISASQITLKNGTEGSRSPMWLVLGH